jgi:hypothetical protein
MFLNYNQSQNPPKIITGTVAGDSWITPHDPRTTEHRSGFGRYSSPSLRRESDHQRSSDISVHILDINEDGVVMFQGKDLFDPKQPYWEGKKPTVKWPEG